MTSETENTKVLLIDDDPSLVRMTRLALVSAGLEVVTANNGQVGLDQMADHDFDVVVLDLQMPVMDGRTFYREMRKKEYRTPVIILSAYGAEAARMELDAEAAIGKPFDPFALVEVIREIVHSNEGQNGSYAN